MSTKFEQLLDYLVNEDMEKANELFHEIVVEKSRDIYENLIAEEAEEEMDEAMEDEDMDESKEEEMDESKEEEMDEAADEDMDESEELEDSYMMDSDEEGEHDFAAGDATDDLGADVMGDEEGHEKSEDSAIFDIKNAIAELEAAFAELEAAQGDEEEHMGMDSEFDDQEGEDDQDESMMGFMEGRRITREYVEKVGHDWDKGSTQKADGDYAGAGSGEKQSKPVAGKSPVSSGKGKPTTGADAKNILGDMKTGEGSNVGTKPMGKAGGLSPEKGEFTGNDWKANSAPGGKAGVKNLSKVGAGYPGNNKTPGPVGSGTGDKAGQTSVGQVKSPINGAPNRNA